MIELPLALALALALAAGGALALVGYALGVARFLGRMQRAVARATDDVEATRPLPAAAIRPLTRVHTVVLDGIAESGKSTLIHRLAFPCTDRASLERLRATRQPVRHRTLPVCLETPPGEAEVLHLLRFSDVSGERPDQIADTLDDLHGEYLGAAAGEPRGRVIALWVWDMADAARNQRELSPMRMRTAYGTRKARELIKGVVVFFNKIDVLEVEPERVEQLIADEERYLRGVVSRCFDTSVPIVFHRGSALDGSGVTDCQGALLDAIGLGHHFRLADGDTQQLTVPA